MLLIMIVCMYPPVNEVLLYGSIMSVYHGLALVRQRAMPAEVPGGSRLYF